MQRYYSALALKELERLPVSVQQRIVAKVRFFAEQDDPLQFAKSLSDPYAGCYRFRIGDYRVIFDLSKKNTLCILRIAKRDEVYE